MARIDPFQLVVEKYGRSCLKCGSTERITKDHIVPKILGGTDDESNLQPLCMWCNSMKGSKTEDYRPDGAIPFAPDPIRRGRKPILEHEKKKRLVLYVTDAERLVIDRYVAGLRSQSAAPQWTAYTEEEEEPHFKEAKKRPRNPKTQENPDGNV